jgi:hypothetical protein
MEWVGQKNRNWASVAQFQAAVVLQVVEGMLWGYSTPSRAKIERDGRWGGMMDGGGGLCLPASLCPSYFSLSFLPHSPPISTHSWPSWQPTGGLCNIRSWSVAACSGRERHFNLSCLAEFQTLTIFDCDFNFHCSIFYRSHKIAKIKNVSTILIQALFICGLIYMVISFQSCKISIYIAIPCWFWNSVNGDYKTQSHGKYITVPRYTTQILGLRFSLRNSG